MHPANHANSVLRGLQNAFMNDWLVSRIRSFTKESTVGSTSLALCEVCNVRIDLNGAAHGIIEREIYREEEVVTCEEFVEVL